MIKMRGMLFFFCQNVALTKCIWAKIFFCTLVVLLLAGCAGNPGIEDLYLRKNQVLVKEDDTLYSIARQHHVSPRQLARANFLQSSAIHPGEVLNIPPSFYGQGLREEVARTPFVGSTAVLYEGTKKELDSALSSESKKDQSSLLQVVPTPSSNFLWPVVGDVVEKLGEASGARSAGISIRAALGTPVFPAKEGTVVYAGDGLFSQYGLLVIVKHPQGAVSVYGHLQKIHVEKAQAVTRETALGALGFSGRADKKPTLYFELRLKPANKKAGKPRAVNPLEYLS